MNDCIRGKVAAIIDTSTLVINLGSSSGVRTGMSFAVFSEHHDIADPDTGEDLGRWELVKAYVVVTHVQEKLCTAKPRLVEKSDSSRTLSSMLVEHSFGRYGRDDLEREKLEVYGPEISGQPKLQPIQVGDGVRMLSVAKPPEEVDGPPD